MKLKKVVFLFVLILLLSGCTERDVQNPANPPSRRDPDENVERLSDEADGYKKIHIYVALCDNKNQGIVPVPEAIGNGQDANNNLYWGTAYGVRTFFKNSDDWKLIIQTDDPQKHVLQRVIFFNRAAKAYIVADAYDGKYIKDAITNALRAMSGANQDVVVIEDKKFIFGGGADLVAYVGHDGLMEFDVDVTLKPRDDKRRDAIILACKSSQYFEEYIKNTEANPLLWTTQLMAPEAYTVEAAIKGWLKSETDEQIHERAAQAYNQYQKCGIQGARGLFKTGF